MPAINIAGFGSECGYFYLPVFEQNDDNAKFCSDLYRAPEQFHHVSRMSICRNVVILGRSAQQHISYATARQQRIKTITA